MEMVSIHWRSSTSTEQMRCVLTLVTGNAPGNDMRFYNERVEASRNFANKVWNASRFIMMNLDENED